MEIKAEKLGKKYITEWIFRDFNYTFHLGKAYAIIGPNGSGKSTLMQALAGYIPCNEGNLTYFDHNNSPIAEDKLFENVAFCSPFLELIEEFTLSEAFRFHHKLKPLKVENETTFFEKIGLAKQEHKYIKHFSSGMKQKLKLGLCLFSNAPVLFLDEPTTNLDIQTKNWYQQKLAEIASEKILIIGSNDPFEYEIAKNHLQMIDFKVNKI